MFLFRCYLRFLGCFFLSLWLFTIFFLFSKFLLWFCLVSPHTSCLCSLLSAPIARPICISITCVLLTFPVYKAHVFPLLSLPAGSATQCAFVPVIPVCFAGPQISGQWLFWFKLMSLFLSLWIFFCQCGRFTTVWHCCFYNRSVVWQLKNTAELNPFACTAFTLGPNRCFRCSWHTLSQNHSRALEMKSHFFSSRKNIHHSPHISQPACPLQLHLSH